MANNAAPTVFDLGDSNRGVVQGPVATVSRNNEFRAAVVGVRDTPQVPELFQLVDQLRRRRQAQLGARRKFGQPPALPADVAPDLQMRPADVAIATLGHRLAELAAKFAQQLDQQLPDRLTIGWQTP